MKIETKIDGASAAIVPTGRIDTLTSPELEEALSKIPQEITALTFDFAGVDYISSAGLRVVLTAQKRMLACGGSMTVAHLAPSVKEVFEITGLAGVLTIV